MANVMFQRLQWILARPWIAHLVSFAGMAAMASPLYRLRGDTPVGLLRYGVDSVVLAVRLPGLCVAAFVPAPWFEPVLAVALWGFTLWPLFQPRTRQWIGRSYLTLFPIWTLYLLGWLFVHLGAVH